MLVAGLLTDATVCMHRGVRIGGFLSAFKKYPPRQKAASFSLDQVMEKLHTNVCNH